MQKLKFQTLSDLINEASIIDVHASLSLDPSTKLLEKHFLISVVKELLEIANEKKYNLTLRNDINYIFNGNFWEILERNDLKLFLGSMAAKMGCPETMASHFEFREKLVKQFLSAAYFHQPDKNDGKILINLENGTLEIENDGTWKIRNFDFTDFLTYQLPFAHDPDAICTKFDEFLQTVLPDKYSQFLLQEFCGYIFCKENLEKMLMLIGTGANGKSVFFNILMAIIGKKNVLNFSMSHFNSETNRAALENFLLNYSSEKGTDLNPDIFKSLVSSEAIQARHLYGKPFNLYNRARFIMNSNSLPKETEQTDAYFRRWLIINFGVTIPPEKRDTELAQKIIADELPGIFNWILEGLDRITQNKQFSYCEKSENELVNFRKQSDNVALFVDDQSFITSQKNKITLASLYYKYRTFCNEDGYSKLGKNNFSKRLVALGFEKTKLNDGEISYFIEKAKISEEGEIEKEPQSPEDTGENTEKLKI